MSPPLHPLRGIGAALLLAVFATAVPGRARADELADLVNTYRAAPASCAGRPAAPMPRLTLETALSRVRIHGVTFLESALERLGYEAEHAEALSVIGPPDAPAAMEALREKYCGHLLSGAFSAIGTSHNGNEWQVVLARPLVFAALPDWQEAGQQLVTLVNAARARPRTCGTQAFGAAGPVSWNPALAEAALGHSTDMANRHYFSHKEPGGSLPADRATRAGYHWTRVGENIASGQHSVEDVMTSWLDSPGHCANIMNPGFTEMGAAWVIDPGNRNHTPFWTQVFGASH
jgi:uncharacterized protein YkwD